MPHPRDKAWNDGEQLLAEYASFFDPRLLSSLEKESLFQRLAAARRQLRHLLQAARQLRLPPRGGPPPRRAFPAGGEPSPEALLLKVLRPQMASLLAEQGRIVRPLKDSVLTTVLDDACRLFLWSNASTLPGFHELTVLAPWWAIRELPPPLVRGLATWCVREVLHGLVLSLQTTRAEVLSAQEVYLGHCVCRSSGVVQDLVPGQEVLLLLSHDERRLLLDRVVDRYLACDSDYLRRSTHERFRTLFDRLVRWRQRGSPRYRLETLLEETYPDWEILLLKPEFTSNWIRSMSNNNKCFPVAKELAFELLNVFFHGRGAIFNSMKCVQSPYSICTCPSPEMGGGCTLTNWYYFAEISTSLVPTDEPVARPRLDGEVLPCRFFPLRARKPCLGCGCDHRAARPRDLMRSLAAADEMAG